MPEIVVYAIEGRSDQVKKDLIKDLTDAVVKNFGSDPEAVSVTIVETSKANKGKGGLPFTERPMSSGGFR